MKNYFIILLIGLLISGCANSEGTTKYDCSYLPNKRVNSAEEAKQIAMECLNHLRVKDYIVDSCKVTLLDSTMYNVVFEKSVNVMPATYMLTVSVSNGCTINIPLK